MANPASERLVFFLGGYDLEMVTIRDLIAAVAPERLFDKQLTWGAQASAYRDEIEAAIARGDRPVLVELPDDLALGSKSVIVADHHGPRAGAQRPTSLHQVFDLLCLPPERWTRWLDLVAANDRGHIPELRLMGATTDEIARIRAADRAAQGVTNEEELAAASAIENAERLAGGSLTVVRIPHAHASAVADPLALAPNPPANLLVISPGEVNFFGVGNLVEALDRRFPGGWYGGALPERGFWGAQRPGDEVREALEEILIAEAALDQHALSRGAHATGRA
jgi:hypothetical protein